ncbi:helix-turn-helix transcriptional regulator [Seohaeicola zhoushanensis]|uniref:Helix-turn-helix transcriptional regulator n=1 Tax=Seohaeicola zhoushanensis TaxID=1569283 RepID=A0A8J3H0T1_9RHOB|nr:helix-turn-helix transcriptional regulator [Seohaeicola zhoushanensis]
MGGHRVIKTQATATMDEPVLIVTGEFIELIAKIGTLEFSGKLLEAMDRLLGGDHCACYRLSDYHLSEIGSASHTSSSLAQAVKGSVYDVKRHLVTAGDNIRVRVIRPVNSTTEPNQTGAAAENYETVLVYARINQASYCLKLLRSADRSELSGDTLLELEQSARFLLTMISRHAELFEQKSDLTPALASREDIEDCVYNMSDLSRREREVCSRILHGMSSCVIADDLGIGKESVMTYRKRAYNRLGIASQRELLMWYLDVWNDWVNSGKRNRDQQQEAA